MVLKRTCPICGKKFIVRSGPQVICGSKTCKKERENQLRRERNARAREKIPLKKCIECGQFFKPWKPNQQILCSPKCRKIRIDGQRKQSYYREKIKPGYREHVNTNRRLRRAMIQNEWGRVGGPKGTFVNFEWEKSEELSLSILKQIGFNSPRRLSYFAHCPFDVRAEKDGKIHVFQVTMRTHIDDKLRHLKLAEDLGLEYFILYIKPDFTGYILKSANEPCADELIVRDLTKVKTI